MKSKYKLEWTQHAQDRYKERIKNHSRLSNREIFLTLPSTVNLNSENTLEEYNDPKFTLRNRLRLRIKEKNCKMDLVVTPCSIDKDTLVVITCLFSSITGNVRKEEKLSSSFIKDLF